MIKALILCMAENRVPLSDYYNPFIAVYTNIRNYFKFNIIMCASEPPDCKIKYHNIL